MSFCASLIFKNLLLLTVCCLSLWLAGSAEANRRGGRGQEIQEGRRRGEGGGARGRGAGERQGEGRGEGRRGEGRRGGGGKGGGGGGGGKGGGVRRNRNINPFPPPLTQGQIVIAASGNAELTSDGLPLLNIFIDGGRFLQRELNFDADEIDENRRVRQNCCINKVSA